MNFTIKNKNLVTLCRFLNQVQLAGPESRERVKFIAACEPTINDLEATRLEMAESYAEKDEDGKPILVDDGKTTEFEITPERQKEFTAKFNKLMDEEFTLSINDGNLTKVRAMKNIVLNTDQPLSGPLAHEHDAWCEAFEKLEL